MKSTKVGKACRLRSIHRGSLNISGVSEEEDGSPREDPDEIDLGGRIRKGAIRTNGHWGCGFRGSCDVL